MEMEKKLDTSQFIICELYLYSEQPTTDDHIGGWTRGYQSSSERRSQLITKCCTGPLSDVL